MKTILVYLLLMTTLMATPETGDIIENPIEFARFDCCFMVKGQKESKTFIHRFDDFASVMNFMSEFKIDILYVRDCEKQKKWRKLTRTSKGD